MSMNSEFSMEATVEWPADRETGEVFDDRWLRAGTTGALTDAEVERAWRAAMTFQNDSEPANRAEVAEYHRAKAAVWRQRILAAGGPDAAALSLRLVRGRSVGEWSEHVDYLKRLGKLKLALSLVYECIEAAEHGDSNEGVTRCGSLYKEASIILRKLGDVEAEIRLVEDAIARSPNYGNLAQRLPRARQLLAKAPINSQ